MYTKQCRILNKQSLTKWFEINKRARQGDILLPTLFAIYINNHAKEIIKLNLGIDLATTGS